MRGKSGMAARGTTAAAGESASPQQMPREQDDAMVDEDGFAYQISEKWAHCYPGVEVAVVTHLGKPPAPPQGYIPLRLGVHNQFEAFESADAAAEEEMEGFSVDTLLWNEELLEGRLEELMTWTHREPLSLRQKLDRINWLVNPK